MNKITSIIFLTFLLFCTSCIPVKDIVYLQNKDNSDLSRVSNPVNPPPYRIQNSDILNISIKTIDPKLSSLFSSSATNGNNSIQLGEQALYYEGFTVNDHGNIRIPLLGEMNVLGFTPDEVRIKIEEKLLAEYFNKASNLFVNVKLSGFRYTVNGEVSAPGTKTVFVEKLNILEAIANSGDISVTGDKKNVILMRKLPQGIETHTIDLTNISALQSPYYYLQPNDYVYVKPLKQKTWGTGKTGIESLSTIITLLSLITTTYLLLKK
jgi:polysaccharide biosynthesis/export protein